MRGGVDHRNERGVELLELVAALTAFADLRGQLATGRSSIHFVALGGIDGAELCQVDRGRGAAAILGADRDRRPARGLQSKPIIVS